MAPTKRGALREPVRSLLSCNELQVPLAVLLFGAI
jgi:hypothetical protein